MIERNRQVNAPDQPPWGKLLTRLREEHTPPLSMREAARRAGFSVSAWTQGEQGYRRITPDVIAPNRMSDDHLARGVLILGGTPDQLRAGGRPEAARLLERLLAAGPRPSDQLAAAVESADGLTDAQKRTLIELVRKAAQ